MDWKDFCNEYLDSDFEAVPGSILIERIKAWRRAELAATDFTQLADSPVDKEAYATYRQEIRDMPDQDEDPRKWTFPKKPV
jgi:hypothetical protein